jgi:predicted DNA-binding transcriptional regulator AlpA
MPAEVIGSAEVGEMLGVTRQRVAQLRRDFEDFPRGQQVGRQFLYTRKSIEEWMAKHPDRRPGPKGPRKSKRSVTP